MFKQTLQRILDQAVAQKEIAGGALLVIKEGKEQAYVQAGYADCEKKKCFDRDTIVRLYSASKPITAAAVMLLVDRGELDLCEPVVKFLPGFENQMVVKENNQLESVKRSMCVKDLLNMVSGLPYGENDGNLSMVSARRVFKEIEDQVMDENRITTIEAANALGSQPLTFHPGESWMYGSSADVLGAIVEVVSGMKFGEFLKREFFEPLEMQDTGFYVPEEKRSRLAKVYKCSGTEVTEEKTNHLGIRYTLDRAPAFESGGAGLVSTLDDYAKFAEMLMQKGQYQGKRILSEKIVTYMTEAELLPWQQEALARNWFGLEGYTYSNLLRIMKYPRQAGFLTSIGEYGWDGWLGFYFANSPADRITMLFAAQKTDAGTMNVTRKLKNVIWKELA